MALDMFRSKGLQSIVMGAVIVATVFIFVIQFNPSAGKKAAKITQSCAATVRGTCIEPQDHKAAFMLLVPIDEHGVRLIGKAKQQHVPQSLSKGSSSASSSSTRPIASASAPPRTRSPTPSSAAFSA